MQSKSNVIRGHEIYTPALTLAHAWEMIKEWARRLITREGLFDAALAVSTFGLAGFIMLVLGNAFQSYAMTAF